MQTGEICFNLHSHETGTVTLATSEANSQTEQDNRRKNRIFKNEVTVNEGIQLCFGNIPSRNTLVLSFASYIQGSIIKTEKLLSGKFVNTSSAKRVLSVIFFHQFWGATNCKIPLKYLQYNRFFGFTLPDDVVEDVWSKRRDENT